MTTNRVAHLQVEFLTLHKDIATAMPEGVDKDNPLCPYVHKTFILHILQDHLNNIMRVLSQTLSPEQHDAATKEIARVQSAIAFVELYPQEALMLNVSFCPDGHTGCV